MRSELPFFSRLRPAGTPQAPEGAARQQRWAARSRLCCQFSAVAMRSWRRLGCASRVFERGVALCTPRRAQQRVACLHSSTDSMSCLELHTLGLELHTLGDCSGTWPNHRGRSGSLRHTHAQSTMLLTKTHSTRALAASSRTSRARTALARSQQRAMPLARPRAVPLSSSAVVLEQQQQQQQQASEQPQVSGVAASDASHAVIEEATHGEAQTPFQWRQHWWPVAPLDTLVRHSLVDAASLHVSGWQTTGWASMTRAVLQPTCSSEAHANHTESGSGSTPHALEPLATAGADPRAALVVHAVWCGRTAGQAAPDPLHPAGRGRGGVVERRGQALAGVPGHLPPQVRRRHAQGARSLSRPGWEKPLAHGPHARGQQLLWLPCVPMRAQAGAPLSGPPLQGRLARVLLPRLEVQHGRRLHADHAGAVGGWGAPAAPLPDGLWTDRACGQNHRTPRVPVEQPARALPPPARARSWTPPPRPRCAARRARASRPSPRSRRTACSSHGWTPRRRRVRAGCACLRTSRRRNGPAPAVARGGGQQQGSTTQHLLRPCAHRSAMATPPPMDRTQGLELSKLKGVPKAPVNPNKPKGVLPCHPPSRAHPANITTVPLDAFAALDKEQTIICSCQCCRRQDGVGGQPGAQRPELLAGAVAGPLARKLAARRT